MHARTKARPEPYVWITSISKLLSGEANCLWSAWFRAHHYAAKLNTDFDASAWQIEHAALVSRTAARYEAEGYAVSVEHQNQFTLVGTRGTLAGRPDIVAVRDGEGWIIDAKTGQPKAADHAQVALYMWALPLANPAYAGVTFRGRVEYKCRFAIIDPGEVDAAFVARAADLLKVICGPDPPRKTPSYRECQNCPLTPDDCADRVETEVVYAGVTEEF